MRSRYGHILIAALVTVALVLGPAQTLWSLVPSGLLQLLGIPEPEPSEPIIAEPLVTTSVPGTSGTVTVTAIIKAPIQVSIPIYRFYSPRSGTHFYTPTAEERDMVMSRWANVWQYEGVAYSVNPAKNYQPLYRFYNRNNGSHFYTSSSQERDMVLSMWSNIYQYDGETYSVTPSSEAGKTPVYRFFNRRNGSHFYTSSAEERDLVLARWGAIYRLEGVGFWLGQ